MDSFATDSIRPGYGTFVVQNITGMPGNPNKPKCVEIFNYPIVENGGTRDLMKIPGVGSIDIKMSLEKGTIQYKLRAQEITILASDIDLTQYNIKQTTFLQNSGVVNGLGSGGGLSAQQHETLRQLIHFVDEGPGDGFVSGAYRVVASVPFPPSITWYIDSTQAKKIVEKLITYNSSNFPITITWNMYDTDGISIIHTVADTIVYNGGFESTRVRDIS